MKSQKIKLGLFGIVPVLLLMAGVARGQDNPQSNPQSASRIGRNPQSKGRIGVDSSKRVTITLRESMLMALENNRDIEVERLNVRMNEFDLLASQGVYDPALVTSLYYDRRKIPATSLFATGMTTDAVGTATVSQRLPWQGSSFLATFDNDRSTAANPFFVLNPQYTTNLSFTFTQPLLRNREIDSDRRQIKIAKKQLDVSDNQFRQRAIEIIVQVQRAYWDLIFARSDHEIKRESVELARTQLKSNERLVDAGSLAPADIISARVELERRTDDAEAAVDAIQRAENSLKALMLQPSNGELWQSELVPVEQPQIEASASLPLEDATRLAFQNRPEMEQYRLRGELNKIDVEFFRNQTKPQIDLFATYGTVGLAGTLRVGENPITQSSALLTARVNQLSALAGLPPLPPPSFDSVNGDLIGGYGQSLANMLKNEFRAYRFGVNINLPLRNRTAQANLGRALAEGTQIDVQRQRQQQVIEVEVRNALQAVETAKKRVEAAKNSRENAELQYQSELRKFEAGQSTNYFVLDRQNALSSARGRELKALTDYTKAAAELQRAMSTTLSSNNVMVK
ncbi:MAG: TolC family protein [Acidobacteria bacterium]|nr:TolC family protein [Acidobacteriota bacterium]